MFGIAFMPAFAHAQVVYVQPARVYSPPVLFTPAPVVTSSYYTPPVTYSSYYTPSVSYYSAPGTVAYSAPVVAYSAPVVTYAAPAPGYYGTRSYYGLGIFRPRGLYTETYWRP